jgi:glyoxylase-like metal-dependent hydrolase (beta-lactamase superfamily II)
MRKILFVAAVFALGLAVKMSAQQRDFSQVEIKVEKIAGNVYMLTGSGGNIGVSVGEDGMLIVDDQFAPLAPRIQAALKGISDKQPRWVLNTHWHFDHVGGNQPFAQSGAEIIAHDNVRKRMAEGGELKAVNMKFDPAPGTPCRSSPSTARSPCTSTARTSARSTTRRATPTGTASSSFPGPTSFTWATTS